MREARRNDLAIAIDTTGSMGDVCTLADGSFATRC